MFLASVPIPSITGVVMAGCAGVVLMWLAALVRPDVAGYAGVVAMPVWAMWLAVLASSFVIPVVLLLFAIPTALVK
jgi:hypothetical protein